MPVSYKVIFCNSVFAWHYGTLRLVSHNIAHGYTSRWHPTRNVFYSWMFPRSRRAFGWRLPGLLESLTSPHVCCLPSSSSNGGWVWNAKENRLIGR